MSEQQPHTAQEKLLRSFKLNRCALAIRAAAHNLDKASCCAAALALATVPAAMAQQLVDIPAQNLAGALKSLGQQTGLQIIYNAKLVEGKQSLAVKGTLEKEEALRRVLSGSGIQFEIQGNSVTLVGINPVDSSVMMLDPLKIQSTAETRFGEAPAEPGGFKAEYQTTSTKMALQLRETPQAISVVTRESLDARQAKDLSTAIELTAGVSNSSNSFGTIPGPGAFSGLGQHEQKFTLRGQPTVVRTDGFTTGSFGGGTDLAAYERVEVVKGPSGFYGQGSLGGFINQVRKKPQENFDASVSVQVGSFDTYRTEADISGALTENKSLQGQMTFAYEDAGSFVSDIVNERVLFAPSLEAVIGDKTRVLLQALYQKDEYDPNSGVPLNLVDNKVELFDNFSSRRELYGATVDKSTVELLEATLTINHELADNWLASLLLQGAKRDQQFIQGNAASVYYGYLYSYGVKDNWERDTWAGEFRLQGKFEAFGQEHQLLLGLEKNNQKLLREYGFVSRYIGTPEAFSGSFSDFPNFTVDEIPTDIDRDNEVKNTAAYAQLVLNLTERTNLLIGARHDKAYQHLSYIGYGDFDQKEEPEKLTTRLGLTHELNENVSVYGIYAESFTPVLTEGRNGLLDPETGAGYEVGVKSEWFDNKLSATLAVYRQELDDRPVDDPTNTKDEFFSISSGLHRTDGVELEISGSPYPGLTIAAAASWMDNEFTEKDDIYYQLSIEGSADKQYSLYADYEWQAGALKGFALGATVVVVDDRHFIAEEYLDSSDEYAYSQSYLDGYERIDLNFAYRGLPNWDISLLIRNVTDEKYIEVSSSSLSEGNYFGSPTAALFKATYHFD